jgi:hypothetical protein
VLEAVSVIVQVASFKLTGKRVFRMAPLHHHFEQKGWEEPTVVIRFWIIASILAIARPGDTEAAVARDDRRARSSRDRRSPFSASRARAARRRRRSPPAAPRCSPGTTARRPARCGGEISGEFPLRDPIDDRLARIAALVLSPGIPHSFPKPHPGRPAARAAGVPIIGDIELLGRAQPEATLRRHHRHQRQIDDDGADRPHPRERREDGRDRRQSRPPALGLAPLGATAPMCSK